MLKQRGVQRKGKMNQRRFQRLEPKQEAANKRRALFDYVFGDKTNLVSFRGLDISDVKQLRIGVFGSTGSGKSCFINTCEMAVRETEKGSIPPQPFRCAGSPGTIILQDFLTEMKFSLVDTRGFFNYDALEVIEFSDILYGRLKIGDFIKRDENEPEYYRSSTDALFDKWLHGIILVVKANDPRLKNGALRDYLKPIRQLLRPLGISPVTVVTYRDTLKTDAACEQALQLASAATGSSTSHTFFVANYCDKNNERNVDIELQIFDILHSAISTAECYVKIAKQQKDEMKRAQKNKRLELKLKKIQRLKENGPRTYCRDSKPRGYCVIINNINFMTTSLTRTGAANDERAMASLFKELHFEVILKKDLTARQIEDEMVAYARKDHTKYDAFVCIIMSHGGKGDFILGVNERQVSIEDLMAELKPQKCPSLQGKPKFFIVQACRGGLCENTSSYCSTGSSFQPASSLNSELMFEIDAGLSNLSIDSTLSRSLCPVEGDFILAFATTPGYVALRNPKSGAVFVQVLADVFRKYHESCHVLELLTEVNRQVAEKTKELAEGIHWQIPAPSFTLRAMFYL